LKLTKRPDVPHRRHHPMRAALQLNLGVRLPTASLPGARLRGQIPPMRLSVELTPALEAQLAAVAARLNVSAEELAAAALRDLLAQREADFEGAAGRVLEKNRELYRRLA
jgi:hypothetical protein